MAIYRGLFWLTMVAALFAACGDDDGDNGGNTADTAGDVTVADTQDSITPTDTANPDSNQDVANDTAVQQDGGTSDAMADTGPAPECVSDGDCVGKIADLGVCQIATCDVATSTCQAGNKKDYTPCNDGDACTLDTVCLSGDCSGGAPKDCDDGNPCTDEVCNAQNGCVFNNNTDACDDGNPCSNNDTCSNGQCGGTDTGECTCTTTADCMVYDDGNLCNGIFACQKGLCTQDPATIVTCPATNDPCMAVLCNPSNGLCELNPSADGKICSDGNPCTTGDQCDGGQCKGGESQCLCANADDCAGLDDNNLCNGAIVCSDKKCVVDPATVVDCGMGDGCKTSTCSPATGQCSTQNLNENKPCDDGNACSDATQCKSGTCTAGVAVKCNDNNPCTKDACDPATGCTFTPDGTAPCTDNDPCTVGDKCADGLCVPGGNTCPPCETTQDCASHEDGNLCNGTLSCQEGLCKVDEPTVVVCDTTGNDDCTKNQCVPATGGCELTVKGDGESCTDGNICTEGDTCAAGVCISGETVCVAGCEENDGPGCGGCECEDCVCAIDAFCCETLWDEVCVSLCAKDCGIDCGGGNTDPDAGCFVQPGAGCGGCACESCVCAIDSFCCTTQWDDICVDVCKQSCGGNCQGGGGGNTGDGCTESPTPTCGGCACEACVCGMDPFCCDTGWDSICVDECINLCGGCEPCVPNCGGKSCGDDGCGGSCGKCKTGESCYSGQCKISCGNGTCEKNLNETCQTCQDDCGVCQKSTGCEESSEPTCGGCGCEACVCAKDPFCCKTAWDAECVASCLLDCDGCDVPAGCTASDNPGCGECQCEECVCETDTFCCETAWDTACVVSCQKDCGIQCGVTLCSDDFDCFDGSACTIESCDPVLGACVYELDPGCCEADSDCDDGDGCTDDVCIGGVCTAKASASPDCCPAGGLVWGTDFEAAIPFTVQNSSTLGGWQLSQAQKVSPQNSMWYGSKQTGNLNFGASKGYLESVAFWLPPSFDLKLSFQLWSGQSNTVKVLLIANNDSTTIYNAQATALNTWSKQVVDLKNFGGNKVVLRFVYESTGGNTKGVYIDDISILSDCAFPVCGDNVCNGNENCFTCAADCKTPGDCPTSDGCDSWEYPGCVGCTCESCVCATMPECCSVMWDNECANACGNCGGSCGPKPGCVPAAGTGCGGCPCESCVCSLDSFCCTTSWDSICVDECIFNCGQSAYCSGSSGPGGGGTNEPGCVPLDSPGCGGCACEACVCSLDSFCCTTAWDEICAESCAADCGACK